MLLKRYCIKEWPKLAWVAKIEGDPAIVQVWHGPMVEANDQWLSECVWDGAFSDGDFDYSDLVFGTGIRCRQNNVIFVSSATGVDCLWHCEDLGTRYISNSLAALLATANLSMRDDYSHYTRDVISIETFGLQRYTRTLPTTKCDIHITYFKNLKFDGCSLTEVDKPDRTPHFTTYEDYYAFLMTSAGRLKVNLESGMRKTKVNCLVGISSGYDSPAAAVVAREAGCTESVTIKQSNSFWRGSDSGAHIARFLGLSCKEYDFRTSVFQDEVTIWAATGRAGGLNLTIFDYPEPLCIFFNGSYGDKVWDSLPHDLTESVGDIDCLIGEFRLRKGIFHCVVPWWGIRRVQEINRLGSSAEMKMWSINSKYDRPIARRLIEEAGVPRGTFAIRKKNTSTNTHFLWPYSHEARASLTKYLMNRGVSAIPRWLVAVLRLLAYADGLFFNNIMSWFGLKKGRRPWDRLAGPSLLFQWANSELKKTYAQGLEAAGGVASPHRAEVSNGSEKPEAPKDRQ